MKILLLIILFFGYIDTCYSQTATGYLDMGNSKRELKDYKGAIQDYSKVIELEPNNTEAYFYRGYLKKELKDLRGAMEDYNMALENDPY